MPPRVSRGPSRRRFVTAGLALAAGLAAGGHTPYRQWKVYRETHLLILTAKPDPVGVRLGRLLARRLAARAPDSAAGMTRAPSYERVGSLLKSRQLDLALIPAEMARHLIRGGAPFQGIGRVPLAALVEVGDHLLVCHRDFPAAHGYRVTQALAGENETPRVARPTAAAGVPVHGGALAYFSGGPLPKAP